MHHRSGRLGTSPLLSRAASLAASARPRAGALLAGRTPARTAAALGFGGAAVALAARAILAAGSGALDLSIALGPIVAGSTATVTLSGAPPAASGPWLVLASIAGDVLDEIPPDVTPEGLFAASDDSWLLKAFSCDAAGVASIALPPSLAGYRLYVRGIAFAGSSTAGFFLSGISKKLVLSGGTGTGPWGPTPFRWVVDGDRLAPPDWIASPGPIGPGKNWVSRLEITPSISLTLYRRTVAGAGASLLEAVVANDPLVFASQVAPGATLSSQTLPDIELEVKDGRIVPILPHLAPYEEVVPQGRYRIPFTNGGWRRIADGAAIAWPFLYVESATGPLPKFEDLSALFPPNPGSMWHAVDPAFPSRTPFEMEDVKLGKPPFDTTRNPWAVQGDDNPYSPTTGYHEDWKWVHLGAYYARGDLEDLLYVLPTVYRQSARPAHFHGYKGDSPTAMFNFCRPAQWSAPGDLLGRVPAYGQTWFIAPIDDDHGWWGLDHQHASLRRVAEFAFATGSPWACQEVLHYGELAKPMLRTVNPQPFGPGFENSTRGYLGWLEIAYRARLLDPTYDMAPAIAACEGFVDLNHSMKPWGKAYGIPQVMTATMSDSWIPGQWAAPSFEDLRAVPIYLRVGNEFQRPKLIAAALEACQWYSTSGWTDGVEGKGKGIKRLVNPLNPASFVEADLSGYNRVSGMGLFLAHRYLKTWPSPNFNGALFLQRATAIRDDAKAKLDWATNLVRYLAW